MIISGLVLERIGRFDGAVISDWRGTHDTKQAALYNPRYRNELAQMDLPIRSKTHTTTIISFIS